MLWPLVALTVSIWPSIFSTVPRIRTGGVGGRAPAGRQWRKRRRATVLRWRGSWVGSWWGWDRLPRLALDYSSGHDRPRPLEVLGLDGVQRPIGQRAHGIGRVVAAVLR